MKNVITFLLMFFLCTNSYAQVEKISKDSLKILEQNKELAKLNTELSSEKLKLAEYQNDLIKLNTDLEKANSNAAIKSAKSKESAEKMAGDAGNTKLAKNAKKDAKAASKANKQASKLTSSVASKQKQIIKSQKKIEELEKKIAKMEMGK